MDVDTTAVRGVVPPKQRRSRETAAKILRAAEELVVERPFNELTVQDLCIAADVSTSSFYARFASKEDVLVALFELHSAEARDDAAAGLAEALGRTAPRAEIVGLLVGHFLRFVRRNGPVMHSIFNDPVLTDRYWTLSVDVKDALTDVLVAVYGSDQPEFRRSAEFAARVAAATIQRAVGLPTNFGERMGLADDDLVTELTLMTTSYLDRAAAFAEGAGTGTRVPD